MMLKILKNNKYFLIGFILSCVLLWPVFKGGYFSHHDDVQVIRLHQMDKCMKDFQIPCRWVPDLGAGYGYPLFNYYAPLPYYFGEIFYLFSNNLIFASKSMFVFSFLLSYFSMYLWAKKVWGEKGALLSAISYSTIPYHAANLYVRGAIGELWAMAIAPLIFYYGQRLINGRGQIRSAVYLGISIALLIISHNLSAMLFLPILFLYLLLNSVFQKKSNIIKYTAVSMFIGLSISCFYWFPAVLESKFVHLDTMTVGYFSYTEHYKGLSKLLGASWDWGASVREYPGSEKDANWFNIGLIHIFSTIFSFLILLRSSNLRKKYGLIIIIASFSVVLSIFMIHPRSIFVWKAFETFLKYLQFPWRFLIVISVFVALIIGGISQIKHKKKDLIILGLVSITFIFNFFYFRPEKFIDTNGYDYLDGDNWRKQIYRSIFDYLPIYAVMPPDTISDKEYELINGDLKVIEYSKGTNWIEFGAQTAVGAEIRVSQYYFPGWAVFVDGERTDVDYNNFLGLITFNLENGIHNVKIRLLNTPPRSIGNIISGLSIFITISYFLLKFLKRR